MSTIVMVVVTVSCLAALAAKVHDLRRAPDDRPLRALCLLLAGLAGSVGIQPVVPLLDRTTGISMLGGFLGECAVLVAAGAGQVFLIRVYNPEQPARPKSQRRYRLLVATLATMAVMFVLGPPDPGSPPITPTGHLSLLPQPYLYLYLYSAFLGGTLVAVLRMTLRYATLTDQRFLRLGLRTLTVGSVVGLVYTIASLVSLTLYEVGVDVDSWESATITPMYLVTDALMLAGCSIPSLAPWVARGRRWVTDSHARRHLHPLWLALYQATPEIALFPPPGGQRADHGDARMHLYRQVIEICDGRLALRPYLDPRAAEIATTLARQARLADANIAAISEAAMLAAAIAAKADGQPSTATDPCPASPVGGTDLAAEVAWLRQVSRAFRSSPIVTDAVRLLSR
jgi:hypothetical protein